MRLRQEKKSKSRRPENSLCCFLSNPPNKAEAKKDIAKTGWRASLDLKKLFFPEREFLFSILFLTKQR